VPGINLTENIAPELRFGCISSLRGQANYNCTGDICQACPDPDPET
jgi:hypothetical protein